MGWQRSLREEGKEPNPGPLHLLTCNVNSARGAWSILDQASPLSDDQLWVLALQEVNMLESEQVVFFTHGLAKSVVFDAFALLVNPLAIDGVSWAPWVVVLCLLIIVYLLLLLVLRRVFCLP